MATQATHIPLSTDAASAPHAVVAVADQLAVLRYLQGCLQETVGNAGQATVREARLGMWFSSLPGKESSSISPAKFGEEAAADLGPPHSIQTRSSNGSLSSHRASLGGNASQYAGGKDATKPAGRSKKNRRGSVTMSISARPSHGDKQEEGRRFLESRLLSESTPSNGTNPRLHANGSNKSTQPKSSANDRAGPRSSYDLQYLSKLIAIPHTCSVLEAFLTMYIRGLPALAIVQAFPASEDGNDGPQSESSAPPSGTSPLKKKGSGIGGRRQSTSSVSSMQAESKLNRGRGSFSRRPSGSKAGKSRHVMSKKDSWGSNMRSLERRGSESRNKVTGTESGLGRQGRESNASFVSKEWWNGPVIGVIRISHLGTIVPFLPNRLFQALLRPVGDFLGLRLLSRPALQWRLDKMAKTMMMQARARSQWNERPPTMIPLASKNANKVDDAFVGIQDELDGDLPGSGPGEFGDSLDDGESDEENVPFAALRASGDQGARPVHGSLSLAPGAATCRFHERVSDAIDRMVLERTTELYLVGTPDESWRSRPGSSQ